MPDYALPRTAHDAVVAGRDMALYPPRKLRHVRAGETFSLRFGAQGDGVSLRAVCIARATLHMARDGLRRFTDEHAVVATPGQHRAAAMLTIIQAAENAMPDAAGGRDRLAVFLGYPDYAALWREISASGRGEGPRGVFVRDLIGWRVK